MLDKSKRESYGHFWKLNIAFFTVNENIVRKPGRLKYQNNRCVSLDSGIISIHPKYF